MKTLHLKETKMAIMPVVLCLHLQRSVVTGRGVYKNTNIVGYDATFAIATHTYTLAAVILHHGGHESGHFVTVRREGTGWVRVSDAVVDRVRMDFGWRDVYMLFYEAK